MSVYCPGVTFGNKRCATVEATKTGGKNSVKLKSLSVKAGAAALAAPDYLAKLKRHTTEVKRVGLDSHFADLILGDQAS